MTQAQVPERVNYVEATARVLLEALQRDPRLVVIGVRDMPGHCPSVSLMFLREKVPDRVREVPFCERGLAGLCLGAALAGARPVVDLLPANALLYALADLIQYLGTLPYLSRGKMRLAMVLRVSIGAALGSGPFQSGNFHVAFSQLRGARIVAPMNASEACALLGEALRHDHPVLLLEHKQLFGLSEELWPLESDPLAMDHAVVLRPGDHATLVSYGYMSRVAMEAAGQLAQEGVQCEVIHLRSLVPLDRQTLCTSVAKTGRVLFVDDAPPSCSVLHEAAADVATYALDYLDAPPLRLLGPDVPTPYSPALEPACRPQVSQIVDAARRLLDW